MRVTTAVLRSIAMLPAVVTLLFCGSITFNLTPLDLGGGYTVAGTVTTNGKVGALAAPDITGWNVTVTNTQIFGMFTPANSTYSKLSSGVSVDANSVSVANPDGSLIFQGPGRTDPPTLALADFTGGANHAYFANAFVFEENSPLSLDAAYAVAHRRAGDLFDVNPIVFADGTEVSGTLTTDGTANLTDWNLLVALTTKDIFTPANSFASLTASMFFSDGSSVRVANPDGVFGFAKPGPLPEPPPSIILADFTATGGGSACYWQPGNVQCTALTAHGADYSVTAIPEPATTWLTGTVLLGCMVFFRRARRRK